MNIEYLRIYKKIPRAVLGTTFFVEICILLRRSAFISDIDHIIHLIVNMAGNVIGGVIFLLLLMTVAVIGVKILGVIFFFMDTIFRKIISLRYLNKRLPPELIFTPFELSLYFLKKHKKQVLDFFRGKSISSSPALSIDYKKSMKNFHKHENFILNHINNLENIELAHALSYYSGVTQEQVLEDYLSEKIDDLKYSWIVILITPALISMLDINISGYVWSLLFILSLVWIFLSIPLLIRLKRRYAYYLIWSYLDTFSFGELAQTVDREAY